jgi:chemotaxis protein CheC
VATIANLLRKTLPTSLPVVVRGDGKASRNWRIREDFPAFPAHQIRNRHEAIHGYVGLLMDIPSIEELRSLVAVFVIHVTQNGTKEIAAADGPKNSRACGLIGFRYEKRRRRHPRGALL